MRKISVLEHEVYKLGDTEEDSGTFGEYKNDIDIKDEKVYYNILILVYHISEKIWILKKYTKPMFRDILFTKPF